MYTMKKVLAKLFDKSRGKSDKVTADAHRIE